MPLFNALMSDLFPGVEPPSVDYGLLQQAPSSYGNRPLDAATFLIWQPRATAFPI